MIPAKRIFFRLYNAAERDSDSVGRFLFSADVTDEKQYFYDTENIYSYKFDKKRE